MHQRSLDFHQVNKGNQIQPYRRVLSYYPHRHHHFFISR
jgi:hypothetical protein